MNAPSGNLCLSKIFKNFNCLFNFDGKKSTKYLSTINRLISQIKDRNREKDSLSIIFVKNGIKSALSFPVPKIDLANYFCC